MKSLVQWIDEGNFIVKGSYDPLTGLSQPVGKLKLLSHQRDILNHCFTLSPVENRFPYTTVILSARKKSGKTTILAAIGNWFGAEGPADQEIYCMASDLEAAQSRAFSDIGFSYLRTGGMPGNVLKSQIDFPNGTFIKAMAKDYKGAAGARHAMTMWDELWAFTSEDSRRMWAEMTPIQIPGVPYSLRVVVTYAGYEDDPGLLWDVYERVVLNGEPVPELAHITDSAGNPVCFRNGREFAYWDTEARMPWQTPAYYKEQFGILRPQEYLRLHENRWASSDTEFVPIEWYQEAQKHLAGSLEYDFKNKRRKVPIVLGVDVGIKRDCTAILGVQYDYSTGMVDQALHKIIVPTRTYQVDLEKDVEDYILSLSEQFKIADVLYDPTQLVRSVQRLTAAGVHCTEFAQTPNNMVAASTALYELLRSQRLRAYPSPDVEEHLRYAVAKTQGPGFRIVKDKNKRAARHIDGAVALAMACYGAIKTRGIDTSKPVRIAAASSELSAWDEEDEREQQPGGLKDSALPLPLREKNYNPGPPGGWRK